MKLPVLLPTIFNEPDDIMMYKYEYMAKLETYDYAEIKLQYFNHNKIEFFFGINLTLE